MYFEIKHLYSLESNTAATFCLSGVLRQKTVREVRFGSNEVIC